MLYTLKGTKTQHSDHMGPNIQTEIMIEAWKPQKNTSKTTWICGYRRDIFLSQVHDKIYHSQTALPTQGSLWAGVISCWRRSQLGVSSTYWGLHGICLCCLVSFIRDWSLITGRGGGYKMGGGHMQFYRKGGAEKVLAVLERGGGGAQKVLG